MAYDNLDRADRFSVSILPLYITQYASVIRWVFLALMVLLSLPLVMRERVKLSAPVIFFTLFYFFQFIYALVDGFDYDRFLLMTVLSFFVPSFISFSLKQNFKIISRINYVIIFMVLLSLYMNGAQVLSGQRFFGFLNNSNLYGMTALFWLVLVLLELKNRSKIYLKVLLIVILLTIILSGSRNGVVGALIVLSFNYQHALGKYIKMLLVFSGIVYIMASAIDISFLTNRLFNIGDAYEDSGRSVIWERAYGAIQQKFWSGNGMNANQTIANIGNMHNCYIRFMLNMGFVFTFLCLLQYTLSLFSVFTKLKYIPSVLLGFLISFALMNIGEDYFVGLGSSVFIYVLFIYGFINYYLEKKNGFTR